MLMIKERWHEAKTLTLTMAKESVRSSVRCFIILAPILQRCQGRGDGHWKKWWLEERDKGSIAGMRWSQWPWRWQTSRRRAFAFVLALDLVLSLSFYIARRYVMRMKAAQGWLGAWGEPYLLSWSWRWLLNEVMVGGARRRVDLRWLILREKERNLNFLMCWVESRERERESIESREWWRMERSSESVMDGEIFYLDRRQILSNISPKISRYPFLRWCLVYLIFRLFQRWS